MGHSMGSFAAMRLFRQFQEEQTSSHPISKLVVWGVGAFLSMSTDLSSFDSTTNHNNSNNGMTTRTTNTPRILKVQGTNDVLLDLTQFFEKEFQTHFPSDTQVEWIEGGTHGGFASYYPNPSLAFPEEKEGGGGNDDDCILSYAEQQDQACALTARFLLGETTTTTTSTSI
jgi:hypothetical protein